MSGESRIDRLDRCIKWYYSLLTNNKSNDLSDMGYEKIWEGIDQMLDERSELMKKKLDI